MSAAVSLQNPATSGRLWSLAAFLAIGLHVAGAVAALVTLRGELDDDASGAPAIDISLEPSAPRDAETAELPPGPATDESAASAPSAASSQAEKTNEEKIAGAEAEDAELSHSEKPEKPVEDQKTRQAEPVVSSESAASEATAPPKSDVANPSDRPLARFKARTSPQGRRNSVGRRP